MSQTISGFSYLKRGLSLLNAPKIRIYVLIPMLINVLIAIAMISSMFHGFNLLATWLDQQLPSWLQWLDGLIWLLYGASILIFFVYLFSIIANLIAAPFNNYLAEAVQRHQGYPIDSHIGLFATIRNAIQRQLQILLYLIPLGMIGGILFFIPIINIVAPFVWWLLTAWMMTLQYSDYAFDNNQIDFTSMRQQLKTKRLLSLSFGGCVTLLSMIPLVNLLIIPTAVIGATLMYTEQFHETT